MPSTPTKPKLDALHRGLETLLAITRHTDLPRSARQEHDALEAIRRLLTRSSLPAEAQGMAAELARFAEVAEVGRVRELIDWFERGRDHLRLFGGGRRRRDRYVLLFILLAKAINPEDRFGILRSLNLLGYWGDRDELDRRLESLRVSRVGPALTSLRLAVDYLETAGAVLYQDVGLIQPSRSVSHEAFKDWSWPRRLLHLIAWHHHGDGRPVRPATNPVFSAGRLEFVLARSGAYSRLVREGGPLAANVLKGLSYRDRDSSRRVWKLSRYAVAIVLIGATFALGIQAHLRVVAFDASCRSLAASILKRFGEPTHQIGTSQPELKDRDIEATVASTQAP